VPEEPENLTAKQGPVGDASLQVGVGALDFILPLAEHLQTEYGRLAWVVAGCRSDMGRLFEHRPGLPSRFPLRFAFRDLEDDELLAIFRSFLTSQPAGSGAGGGLEGTAPVGGATAPPPPTPRFKEDDVDCIIGYTKGKKRTDAFGVVWTWNGNLWQVHLGMPWSVMYCGPR
jgi:hypothetical protein